MQSPVESTLGTSASADGDAGVDIESHGLLNHDDSEQEQGNNGHLDGTKLNNRELDLKTPLQPNDEENTTCQRCSNCTLTCWRKFFIDNFLPIGLVVVVLIGAVWPTPGLLINHKATQYFAVVGIFLISGLFLKTDEIKTAVTSYVAIVWGIVSILFVTSVIGVTLTGLLPFDQKEITVVNHTKKIVVKEQLFGADDLQRGLQVFFSAPCTVSTGVVMVNQLGGNYALALILTVVCNILGTFTMPLLIDWLVKLEGDVSLDIGHLLMKLSLTIFLPTVAGKALQYLPNVGKFCGKFKVQLKLLSTSLLLLLPWIKISEASASGKLSKITARSFLLLAAWALTLHVIFLIINTVACFVFRFDKLKTKCLVIIASQKTLAVSLSVVNFLPDEVGSKGVMVIPMLVSHFTMILVDSVLIVVWAKFSPAEEELKCEAIDNEDPVQVTPKEDVVDIIEDTEIDKENS